MGSSWSFSNPPNSRKRNRSVVDDNDSNSEIENDEMPKRKRRRITPSPAALASNALRYVMVNARSFLARGLLMFLERAALQAADGDFDDAEVIDSLIQLIEYMGAYSDISILRRGLRAIHAFGLCLEEKESQLSEVLVRSNDIETLVAIMSRHPHAINVQLLGCRALRLLVIQQDDWNSLWEAGVLAVFLQAIQNHPDNITIQGLSIAFIGILVRETGDAPRKQVLEMRGVEMILASMNRYKDDNRMQHTACYTIHQLGFSREAKDLILLHGGVQAMISTIQEHKNDRQLIALCLSALNKLCDENTIPDYNILPLVHNLMEVFENVRAIQGHCLLLLLKAAPRQTDLVATTQSIRLTLNPMKAFQDCPSIQFFGCALLREILQHTLAAGNVNPLNDISSMGGIECVLSAVETHRHMPGLKPMALLSLMHIWENGEQNEASRAFGGSSEVVAQIAGLRIVHVDVEDELD